MNRKISSLIIVLLIAALTIYGNYCVSTITANLSQQVNNIIISAKTENQAQATVQIENLKQSFKTKKHVLEFFIKRDFVANIGININGFEAYVNKDTWRDLESEAAKALEQIDVLKHLFFRIA